MRFAKVIDMEPGFLFRPALGQRALTFDFYEPIVSRFPGKRRGRVHVREGARCSFVADWDARVVLVVEG